MSFLLCDSSICTLVWSNDVKLKISLIISAGSRSIKNIGSLSFVVLWITFDTWRTVYPFSSMAIPMSTVGVDGCRLQMTIRKGFSSCDW